MSERPPICTVMLMWLPGVGATNSPAISISNILTSGARSRVERSTAARHSMGAATARLLSGLVMRARRRRVLPRQEPVDQPPRPECAGVDVEIVEGHAGIAVDGLLLRLEDRVILVVDAVPVVDVRLGDVPRELLVIRPEGADEVPEIMAGRLAFRRDGGEECAVHALRAIALRRARAGDARRRRPQPRRMAPGSR